jgi:cytochrome P450
VERFTTPGWRLTELLNGKRAKLNACCGVIHSFATNIIQQRRKLLAQHRAAGTAADESLAAEGAAAGSCEKEQDEDDSSAQDLLSLFMEAKGADGKPLSDKQLVDTVINFIIAGRDTTAQVGCLRLSRICAELVWLRHAPCRRLCKLLQHLQKSLCVDALLLTVKLNLS